MEPTITNAFLVTCGFLAVLLILAVVVCVIIDYYNYVDLQERLERERIRKQAKREEEQ